MSEREQRATAVAQMNANQAIEGLRPDSTDKALQAGYVEGTVTIEQLLDHAQQFAEQIRAEQS